MYLVISNAMGILSSSYQWNILWTFQSNESLKHKKIFTSRTSNLRSRLARDIFSVMPSPVGGNSLWEKEGDLNASDKTHRLFLYSWYTWIESFVWQMKLDVSKVQIEPVASSSMFNRCFIGYEWQHIFAVDSIKMQYTMAQCTRCFWRGFILCEIRNRETSKIRNTTWH